MGRNRIYEDAALMYEEAAGIIKYFSIGMKDIYKKHGEEFDPKSWRESFDIILQYSLLEACVLDGYVDENEISFIKMLPSFGDITNAIGAGVTWDYLLNCGAIQIKNILDSGRKLMDELAYRWSTYFIVWDLALYETDYIKTLSKDIALIIAAFCHIDGDPSESFEDLGQTLIVRTLFFIEEEKKEIDVNPEFKALVRGKYLEEKDPKTIYKQSIDNVLEIKAVGARGNISLGTGFVISGRRVLTNAHVVTYESNFTTAKSDDITCILPDKTNTLKAKVLYVDEDYDVAILQLPDSPLLKKILPLSNNPLETGDKVYTIGNTKGRGLCFLEGMVTDVDRRVNGNAYFMFDAMIYHGNSGGPVLDKYGEVVGIATAGDTEVAGMNYAIPVRVIKYILKREGIK